jgi:DNA-binding transcriptional LysR family regulator
MDTVLSLQVFRQIVESGTFTAAADKMDMSVAMVSKHVRHLEARVGSQLLHRTSRRISLSEAGQLYYERCSELLNTLEETEGEIRSSLRKPQGTLKITAPSWFGNPNFARRMTQYREQYPLVKIDLTLHDGQVDLVEQGLDLALRVSLGLDANLPARKIAPLEFGIVGSHQYFEKHGPPARVEDLMKHRLVAYAYEAPNALSFPLPPADYRTNNTTMLVHLVGQGAGLAILPRMAITDLPDWPATYRFVLPQAKLPRPHLYAVTHQRRRLSARITTFLDYLADGYPEDSARS